MNEGGAQGSSFFLPAILRLICFGGSELRVVQLK
ncbi:MAG: hypothetical protein ACJAYM_002057, partial [Flavobacteriales bacterium]